MRIVVEIRISPPRITMRSCDTETAQMEEDRCSTTCEILTFELHELNGGGMFTYA